MLSISSIYIYIYIISNKKYFDIENRWKNYKKVLSRVKSARILCYVACDSEGFFVMLNSKLSRKRTSESVWHLLIVFYFLSFVSIFLQII